MEKCDGFPYIGIDSRFSTEFERFDDPVSLIENLRIGGSRLIDIIDNLEEVEPM